MSGTYVHRGHPFRYYSRHSALIEQHITYLLVTLGGSIGKTTKPELHFFHVCCHKSHGCKSRRTDCKSFSGCCGGIAQHIQGVSALTNLLG